MFDFNKIGEQIAEKIKPALAEGKKQAEISLLANIAAQIYCSENMRGITAHPHVCVELAKSIIKLAVKEKEKEIK